MGEHRPLADPDGRGAVTKSERAAAKAARCRERLASRVELVPGVATLVAVRAGEPAAVVAGLAEAGVLVREIPGTGLVRASCGWWTSDGDLERLAEPL